MIQVTYLPAEDYSPFPDGVSKQWIFKTHQEFKAWVQSYVCVYCLMEFYEFTGRDPKNVADWLDMGCGVEIDIIDNDSLIKWDDPMMLTESYKLWKNSL